MGVRRVGISLLSLDIASFDCSGSALRKYKVVQDFLTAEVDVT